MCGKKWVRDGGFGVNQAIVSADNAGGETKVVDLGRKNNVGEAFVGMIATKVRVLKMKAQNLF